VKWAVLQGSLTPDHPSQITYQCTDPVAAQALAKLLAEKAHTNYPNPPHGRRGNFFQAFHGAQPQIDSDRVTVTLNPTEVDTVILERFMGE
jgi:hypothetical protein